MEVLQFFGQCLLVFLVLIISFIAYLILFGSSVDPDDNGLLRSPKAREKYRAEKLKRFKD